MALDWKRDRKRSGDTSEVIAMWALLESGFDVAVPFGQNQRWDIVAEKDSRLCRIQVKTGRLRKGVVTFKCCSSHYHRGGRWRNYKGTIDSFAVYCPDNGGVYLVPVDTVPDRLASLRTVAPKNGYKRRIHWANDYLIATWQLLR